MPDMLNTPIELQDTPIVRRSSVILVVAAELGGQGFLLLVHRFMTVRLAPLGDFVQAPAEPFTHRPHMYCERTLPALGADMCKAEESKCVRFSTLPFCLPHCTSSELQQPRLLRVERQPIFCKPFG
jgi:hypothetical protein